MTDLAIAKYCDPSSPSCGPWIHTGISSFCSTKMLANTGTQVIFSGDVTRDAAA